MQIIKAQNFDTNNLLAPKAGTLGITQNYALCVSTWDVNYLPSPMTQEAYPTLAAAHYDELRAIGQEPDFYTLEEKFDQMQPAPWALGAGTDAGLGAGQQEKKTSRPSSGA